MDHSACYSSLIVLASLVQPVHAHDGAAATITIAVLLLLVCCCIGTCCLSGVGLASLCRGSVRDYDPECEEAREVAARE